MFEAAEWSRYRRFISEKQDGRSIVFVRNDSVIRNTVRYFGCFAIRTNEVADPLEALSLYRRRNIVEQAFNQYKNQVQVSRLFSTQKTYMGKLLVHLVAQSLRMMLYMNARNNAAANPSLKLPHESLSKALMVLRTLCAVRPVGANHWILREETKKQRDLLTLLGLDLGPSKNRLLNY